VITEWLLSVIRKEGRIELDEAKNSGAWLGKCDQNTVLKYINAMTSRLGPLRVVPGPDETQYLVLKSGRKNARGKE